MRSMQAAVLLPFLFSLAHSLGFSLLARFLRWSALTERPGCAEERGIIHVSNRR